MTPNLIKSLGAFTFFLSAALTSPTFKFENLKAREDIFVVSGVQDGGVKPRQEIRTLAADPVQWNLFLLSMIEYQKVDPSDMFSYYQIAGIHGVPFVSWDGVGATGDSQSGYCPHGSVLFGSWHIPYLALHEQQIHEWGVAIASQFTGDNSQAYQQAALDLRLPYWDWAANPPNNGPIFPDVLSSPTASVTYPDGSTATVPNPLFSYNFNPLVPGDFQDTAPFCTWSKTLRWPTSTDAQAESQNAKIEPELEANFGNIRSQLMTLFANPQPYNHFSNKGSGSSGFGNLESIHDVVHMLVGGNTNTGHLTITQVSSFDPTFWVHHANIDRMIALWLAIYGDTYVEPTTSGSATYTIPQGSTLDKDTPLTPFHRDTSGNFYSSESARDIKSFGYTYPELVNSPDSNALKETIAGLYAGPASTFGKREVALPTTLPRDYIVKIHLPWTALNGTYSVAVFLGKCNDKPEDWSKHPAFVGTHATLCGSHMPPNDIITSGNVHLTDAILKRHSEGVLPDLEEQTIINFLTANLEWKAQHKGQEIDITSLTGANVTTQSIEVADPSALGTFSYYSWVGEFKNFPCVFGECCQHV